MTPARLHTVEEIFHTALEQNSDNIARFVETACEGDELLRREVEALLASHQRAQSFIETSTTVIATRIIENRQADLLIGQTIGHYKISGSIGTGGMGEVYLATDIVAGRKAALKLLPLRYTGDAARLRRFQQEAHAVVALNHPNIVTVYEIGEDHSIHYIASELIEGETLHDRLERGPMQLNEAVDVAIQVASALAAAHQAGIVHRDIKPENIMLRPDGYVKVLDFGIAKLAEQEVPLTMPRDEALLLVETNLGSILGTVRYMSPEQACGAHVDRSTDIWSLGAVLYEMVTGHVPFTGDTPKEVMSAILEKEQPPLRHLIAHAPAELQQIISKALVKNREQRYRSAHELLEVLKRLRHNLEVEAELQRASAPRSWLHRNPALAALLLLLLVVVLALALPFYWHRNLTTSASPDKSIAVLPLENLSDDKENAFFADGIHDELLSNLAKIKDLKVISRTSVTQYKSGISRNLKEIAQQLGVGNVVEGSVRRSGDHVRVSVQLIDARTDRHLWGENYDRTLADSLALQGELATEIAATVGATLSPHEKARIEAKPTNNAAAYDAYIRGRAFRTGVAWSENAESAIRLYQEAVKFDPNSTLAWAYLSCAQIGSYWSENDHSAVALAPAKDSLDRALALDPNLPETHLAAGYYRYYGQLDFTGALTEFQRAEQGLPNNVDILQALVLIQRRLGHWEEAIEAGRRAVELDPRNVVSSIVLAETYRCTRRFPEVLATADRLLALDPTDGGAIWMKASVFLAAGDLDAVRPLLANPSTLQILRGRVALFQRRYAVPIEIFSKELATETDPDLRTKEKFLLALSQQRAGDVTAARETYQNAAQELQRELQKVASDPVAHADLGLAYAGLGKAASAIAEGQKATALQPTSKDSYEGPAREEAMARIYSLLGDADHAIPILKRLLQIPYYLPITTGWLRLDPVWDQIRNDPRFQELVAEKKP